MNERLLEDRWRLIHRVRTFDDPDDIDYDYKAEFKVLWLGEDLPDSSDMGLALIKSMAMSKVPAFVPDEHRYAAHEGLILQQKKVLKVGRSVCKLIWLDADENPEDY
jgi:hypothetical protein